MRFQAGQALCKLGGLSHNIPLTQRAMRGGLPMSHPANAVWIDATEEILTVRGTKRHRLDPYEGVMQHAAGVGKGGEHGSRPSMPRPYRYCPCCGAALAR